MALSFSTAAATISSSEISIFTGGAGPTSQTAKANVRAIIDASAMVAGQQFRVRWYEKINGVQKLSDEAFLTGAQSSSFDLDLGLLGDGYDVTITKIAGTDCAFGWTIHLDDTQALTELLEGTLKLGELLRAGIGVLLGRATGLSGTTPAFKSIDGTKVRVTITVDDAVNTSARTSITLGDLTL